jgi:5'-AMP-activated protein kinase, regulatory gamma subunit
MMDVQLHSLGADNLPTGGMISLANEQEVVRRAGRQAISAFLDSHNCFSVLRASGKVVVFDTRIPIQLAFYALVEHGASFLVLSVGYCGRSKCCQEPATKPCFSLYIYTHIIAHRFLFFLLDMQAAPIWDASSCQFVGLLKVTDFIDILRLYRATNSNVASLATRSIAEMFQDESVKRAVGVSLGFDCADSTTTLKQACKLLLRGRGDFLPVVMPEDMRVLACITYTNVLEHLVTHFREQRRLFDDTIFDLRIGTYGEQLVTVSPQQTLADALELMHRHQLGALPVVESDSRKLVGVYSRSDITFLTKATDAEDAVANLNLTLANVLEQQRTDVTTPDAMHTCSKSHTLQSIFEYFAQLRFNRLFVMDAETGENLVGVVSAKDLVAYFMHE